MQSTVINRKEAFKKQPYHNKNQITDQIWPIIKLLKIMGYILITKPKSNESEYTSFYFKYISWDTIIGIFGQTLLTVTCCGVIITS